MPAGPDFAPGSEFAGHRVEAVAGRGGMGVVYRATDLRLRRTVALKLIAPELSEDPSFRTRFERESRTAAAIRHPNVITIFHAGEYDGLLYITMEYIEGTDLGDMITRNKWLDLHLAVAVVSQVGYALDAAHRHGLIHRDIKPANILLANEEGAPHAYLTDFGLTKSLSSESGVTGTGLMVGTVDYMAPEQAEGDTLDHRTDVYALGCVLYNALTGEVPYPRDTLIAKLYAKTHEPPPSVLARRADLPPELDLVVKRAMARRPEDRYTSAGELGRGALAAARTPSMTHRAAGESSAVAASPAKPHPEPAVGSGGRARDPSSGPVRGWYPDPKNDAIQRYWDGAAWTHWTHPKTLRPVPPSPAPNVFAHPRRAPGGRRWSLWWIWACIPWLTPVAWLHAFAVTNARRHLPFIAIYLAPIVVAIAIGNDAHGQPASSAVAIVAVVWIGGGLHAWRIARSVNREFVARRSERERSPL